MVDVFVNGKLTIKPGAKPLAKKKSKKIMSNLVTEEGLQQPASPMMAFVPDMGLSEEYLARRFARPERRPGAVVYELTRDPGLLQQYYQLREEMFISVWGLKHFSGQKDAYDDNSEIMVARIGNHCIGGCRLTFSRPGDRHALPMEKEDFRLKDKLPEIAVNKASIVEISRMAILPEFQNSLVMLELSRQLLKCGADKHARYAFTLAPVPLARNYRKAAHLFGLKWQIRNDVAIPAREEYEGINMVLSMLDLSPVYKPKPERTTTVKAERELLAAT